MIITSIYAYEVCTLHPKKFREETNDGGTWTLVNWKDRLTTQRKGNKGSKRDPENRRSRPRATKGCSNSLWHTIFFLPASTERSVLGSSDKWHAVGKIRCKSLYKYYWWFETDTWYVIQLCGSVSAATFSSVSFPRETYHAFLRHPDFRWVEFALKTPTISQPPQTHPVAALSGH